MKTWSTADVELLKLNYNTMTNAELQKLFPTHSAYGIYKKAYKMGLRKSPEMEWKNRSEARKGEKGSNWNGGVRYTKKGYKQILLRGHRRADVNGYVMEHIVVWENSTGVPVPDNCVVHHLNGNKTDNRIANLCLMERGAHTTYHHTGTKQSVETREKIRKRRRGYYAQQNHFAR